MRYLKAIMLFVPFIFFSGCVKQPPKSSGKLFIIGGGEKPLSMIDELVNISGIRTTGYMYVLPMSSSVPDSAIIWEKQEFGAAGIKIVPGFNFKKGEVAPQAQLDSLRNAKLIYISGGDQSVFMDVVLNTPVMDAIHEAYRKGAVIAGTSAGAAVMSKIMITGNQKKHPELDGYFPTIESKNMEIREGLGFLQNTIIDQHFIRRQRLNRLISVSVENPGKLCAGIDESTAILVEGKTATVKGNGQVVVIRNKAAKQTIRNGLLGAEGLEISIYLPGDSFKIE